MQKEKQLEPKLRFPKFKGGWKIDTLGKLGEIVTGLTYTPNDINKDGVLVLRSSNVQNGNLAFEDNVYVKTNDYNKVIENDILLVVRNGSKRLIGKCALITKEYEGLAFGAFMSIYRSNFNRFLIQWFWSDDFRREVHKNLGATINSINGSNLKKFKVYIPSQIEEQQKIATFLTAIDSRLKSLEKKKSLLEEYKKGVMQQIFKQELRFKDEDGKEFPEWEFKRGNLLFKSVSDKDHNSDLPILAITQDQGAIPRDQIDYNIGVTAKSVSSYKVVQVGDFIISLRSFQGGIEYSNYHGICSPAYIILRPIKEMDRDFYKYYLKTPSYIGQLVSKLEGIRDGKMVSYKYFSEIKLPYPSLKEQTKIANFLSAIDKKIELVSEQIEKTKTYKKGLLQQMFV
ncbi:MAG: hypothetical protein CL526_12300 [Aequorivita sp.]|nr:hypothetical protein [Aequorivita sp.]|tara:strand:- start:68461 stop:69657 length:1197 start_codon:yes stop_codon:yes gene_type:complete